MFLGRFGSLNSLEKTQGIGVWRKYLDRGELPSADTLGRVASKVDPEAIRRELVSFYRTVRRNKALSPDSHGLTALVFDGHESTSSYLRECSGCLKRRIRTKDGVRVQHYHRYVAASLVGKDAHCFLDIESIRPGEDEIAAARRLYARVHSRFARAYDVVLGDALYLEGPFFQDVIDRGKHVLAVLKRKDLNLFKDAEALFAEIEPLVFQSGGRERRCWDVSGFTSFSTVKRPLRVVKSVETWHVRGQISGEIEEMSSCWMWATTLPSESVDTRACVALAHSRWDIENQGFNEARNHYHIDHVYHHDPGAMLVLTLLAMLAINLFRTFYRRNLKPAFRRRFSRTDAARMILAIFFVGLTAHDTS